LGPFYLIKQVTFVFVSLVLVGKSTAPADEIEAKEKELARLRTEQEENIEERRKIDEQNTIDGDKDDIVAEKVSAEELFNWDELMEHTKQTIEALEIWFNN
jgi:hypothetical protein